MDEALNNIPGVVVSNRYNFSLDQRISIRGFGSRSNFGVRGLKILLDGIPQTLPDGQSQLTNIDFADIERAEVLRGASSSLYGNASGGVIVARRPSAPRRARSRSGCGCRAATASGTATGSTSGRAGRSGRSGSASGTLSVSQFKADGFRQHSAARDPPAQRRRRLRVPRHRPSAPLRLSLADNPEAQNPGALTCRSTVANPDSPPPTTSAAAPTRMPSSTSSRSGCGTSTPPGTSTRSTCSALLRDLANPLAAPPPDINPGPTAGTFVGHRPGGRRRPGQRHPAARRRRRRRRG